jgi:tRNA modification GTPase
VQIHAHICVALLQVSLNIKGYPFMVADTAGLRESDDEIEREGVRRARDRCDCA